MKLFQIIKKNILILLRSKSSALIVLLGPLIVIFLVGVAFSTTSQLSLKVGYYSPSYNELTNSFVDKLKENYKTIKFSSEQSCVDEIKVGNIHACVIFPADLQIEKDVSSQITFYVDYSKVNLVWAVINTVSSQVSEKTQEISVNLTTVLIEKLDESKAQIEVQRQSVDSVKKQVDSVSEKLDSANKKIIAMDLKFNQSDFRTDELQSASTEASSKSGSLVNSCLDLKTKVKDTIVKSQNLISAVRSKVGASNATASQKDDIESVLSSSESDLASVNSQLNASNCTIIDFTNLNSLISNTKTKVDGVSAKLSAADKSRNEASGQLSEVSKLLGSVKDSLTTLQGLMEQTKANIDDIKVKNVSTIVSPVTTKINPVIPEKSYLNYIFPTLITLTLMFVSIILATTMVLMEKKSAAFFRNFITPTSTITFFLAIFITIALIVAVQLVVIMGIALYFFKINFSAINTVLIILSATITVFVLLGILIGYLFSSEETATLAAISLGSVLLFMSNVVVPLESMPQTITDYAKYNPFVISDTILKKTILFNTKLEFLKNDIYTLLIYSAILIVLVLIVQVMLRKNAFTKLVGRTFLKAYRKKFRQ